jgi:hypothetical protein
MVEKFKPYMGSESEFISSVIDAIREQTLTYILYKANKFKTLEDFKEQVLKELSSLHDRNMERIENFISKIND